MKKKLCVILIIFFIVSCSDRDKLVDRSHLTGKDYRLFQETPVWPLAKAVWNEDTMLIRKIATEQKIDVNYQEQRFGKTLLMLAVSNQHYNSCKALLQLEADPNKHDKYNGSSAIINAAEINESTGDNTKYLRLLLHFNGNPNDVEVGDRPQGNTTRKTPLMASITLSEFPSSLPNVKLLVESGADINYRNEYGQTALREAVLLENYEVVLYLLRNGADYQQIITDRTQFDAGESNAYLVDVLREYLPELNSKEHKIKMEVVDFLMQKGIDYKKVPVPDYTLKEIKEIYPNTWKDYKDNY